MKLLATSFGLLALVFFLVIPSYAQETSSLEILVQNTKGDRVDHYEMNFLVYEKNNNIPILEIVPTSNPYIIDSLTLGKQYQINVYVNSMYGATYFVNLDESEKSVIVSIPTSGGFRLTVLYNDAYTPIDGASVSVSSHDGKHWRDGITSKDGKTMRFWMQPTNPYEYYNIEVSLSKELVFQGPQVSLSPTSQPEIKIVTDWPPIVDHLITIESYKNNAEKISNSDGKFVVELIDAENNIVDTSPVNYRGESHFSNLKVGEYTLRLVKTSFGPANYEEWALKRISISGMEDRFKLGDIQDEKQSCNCVAFRLDDIQDLWIIDSQMRLLSIFEDKKIPITIGIVGAHFGEDDSIVGFIQEKLDSGNFSLEIANHSWNDDRLTDMTKLEQLSAILKTNDRIIEILQIKPTTFIPPGNLFNEDTVTILQENEFTHLSATTNTDPPPYVLKGKSFYHFPQTAETGVCEDECSQFFGVSHQKTFADVKASIQEHGYAVIMMHPQEFSVWENGAHQNIVNEKQIQELEELIAKLNGDGIDIVPLGKLNLDAPDSEKLNLDAPDSEKLNLDAPDSEKLNLDAPDSEKPVNHYEPTCNCIAFRLDTVQDWWLADVSTMLIDKFNQKQIPLTIGIIGNFIGADPNIVEFLKNSLKQNQGSEIANNGWNYEDFSKFNKDEQKVFLIQSNDSIQNALGVQPTVFIPPHNRYDDSTLAALKELGFTHISSIQALSGPPYPLEKESFYHFPSTTSTAIFDSVNLRFDGLPYETILQNTKNSIEQHGFAVVSLNPQEFAMLEGGQVIDQIESKQFNELEKLLKVLTKSNFEIVPISHINIDSEDFLEIPDWVRNNAGWWADDQITDSDFTSGIEFMIKEKIIRIPELPESESTIEEKVPDWIKNNAGWWAQDLISDEDFVNGIEYLVKNGIILV